MTTAEQLRNLQHLYDAIPHYDGRVGSPAGRSRIGILSVCAGGAPRYGFATPTLGLALELALRARPFRYGGIGQALFGRRLLPTSDRKRARILRQHYGLDREQMDAIREVDESAAPAWHDWCRPMLACIGSVINSRMEPDAPAPCRPGLDIYVDDDLRPLTWRQSVNLKNIAYILDTFPPTWTHVPGHMPAFLSVSHIMMTEGGVFGLLPASDVAARRAVVSLRRVAYGVSNRDLERMENLQRRDVPCPRRAVAEIERIIADGPGPAAPVRGVNTNVMPPATLEVQTPERDAGGDAAMERATPNRRVAVRTVDRTNGQ